MANRDLPACFLEKKYGLVVLLVTYFIWGIVFSALIYNGNIELNFLHYDSENVWSIVFFVASLLIFICVIVAALVIVILECYWPVLVFGFIHGLFAFNCFVLIFVSSPFYAINLFLNLAICGLMIWYFLALNKIRDATNRVQNTGFVLSGPNQQQQQQMQVSVLPASKIGSSSSDVISHN